MKRFFSILVALAATITLGAQNIAVVSPSLSTAVYQTLDDAITNADPGSTIYLPGGGFVISDNTAIDKKLTIMGVSHRGDADNVDGATVIIGRLNFVGGSSGSAVIGVYMTGNIDVGDESAAVENFTLKYCNVYYIEVHNSGCVGMVVNQCYLRSNTRFGGCNVSIKNCVTSTLYNINGGTLDHNVILRKNGHTGICSYALLNVSCSSITNNFFLNWGYGLKGNDCYVSNNCIGTSIWDSDQDPVVAPEGTNLWDDVFEKPNGCNVAISSDYHVIASWAKGAASDGTDIGIYGGSGFSEETSLAPIPRIVSKSVAEQSDASGRLTVTVTVKSK